MCEVVVKVHKFDDQKFKNRILYYSYIIDKKTDMDLGQQWIEFEEKSKEINTSDFVVKFEQETEKIQEYIGIEVLNFVIENDQTDKVDIVSFTSAWNDVKKIVGNGSDWIIRLYKYLKKLSETHIKLAKVVLSILISILTGLVGDCVYDGIKSVIKEEQLSEHQEIKFVDETSEEIIMIEDEEGYYFVYYDKSGKIVMKYIPKEQLIIVEKDELQ